MAQFEAQQLPEASGVEARGCPLWRRAVLHAVKFAGRSDDRLDLLAIPFGAPEEWGGRDTDGEYFTPATDLCLDWYPDRMPLLFQHGLDPDVGLAPVGHVQKRTLTADIDGVWVQAQLDKSSRYFESIKELVKQRKLYGSSGAAPHLVRTDKATGEILVWPWAEQSLTPTPANLLSRVSPVDLAKHYKQAHLPTPEARELFPPADGREFADVDNYTLPISTATYVREALVRFNSYRWADASALRAGARRIIQACERFGIEVPETVAQAAKSYQNTVTLGRAALAELDLLRGTLERAETVRTRLSHRQRQDLELLRLARAAY